MGKTDRTVVSLSALGKRLLQSQQENFQKCMDYYENLTPNEDVFTGDHKALLKSAHKVAFTMSLLVQKFDHVPDWALPYLLQLKSDTIQLIPSITLGNKRTLHLYERASIEDFLRYVYFFDHRVEHLQLQTYPTKFLNFEFLIEWVKNHPSLIPYEDFVSRSCGTLTSKYKELSRTIHGTRIVDLELFDSLQTLHRPLEEPTEETNLIKTIFGNIIFLLCLFHVEKLCSFSLDERAVISQHLTAKEKQKLSGLEAS